MKKLAIIDMDGIVANRDARLEKARQAYLERMEVEGKTPEPLSYRGGFEYDVLFDPVLVELDTLIDGVKEALETLRYQYDYALLFLTSRPERMREATIAWLFAHNILFYQSNGLPALVTKPPAFQYMKTRVWKAGMVQTLANWYGASIVKFIDDQEENWQELLKHTPYTAYSLEWCSSLAQTVDRLREGAQESL